LTTGLKYLPVFDKNIKNELKRIFEIQWSDNIKARKIDSGLTNKFVKRGKEPVHSQVEVYKFIKALTS
jgi:polyphosphate kinase